MKSSSNLTDCVALTDSVQAHAKANFRIVGKVKDAHGLKGELFILLFAGQADWLENIDRKEPFQVWLPKPPHSGRLTPEELAARTIEVSANAEVPGRFADSVREIRVKPFKSGLIAALDGVRDRTEAEKWIGHLFAIPSSFLVGEENYFLAEVEGYQVTDVRLGELGVVSGFSHNGAQDLLLIRYKETDKVVEIPFVADWIKSIEPQGERLNRGVIEMDLPEGLIEVQIEPS